MPLFCRHNRLTQNCPICSRELGSEHNVTGSGRADKAQVTAMVTKLLGLREAPRPADAADALAIAITHAHHRQSRILLQKVAAS